jgi:hypothetical protein
MTAQTKGERLFWAAVSTARREMEAEESTVWIVRGA